MPTRYRDALMTEASGLLTITKHPDGCLWVFPRPVWEQFRTVIVAMPQSEQWTRRFFLGNAMDVEIDATGRVLVAPELRQSAGLDKDVWLMGMGKYLELWDKATYDAQEAKAIEMGELQKDAFKGMSF